MPRYYLAYATAIGGWRYFRDLLNFRRLAALDPGVARVDILIAVGGAAQRTQSDCRNLARLCRLAETNPRLRVREIAFLRDAGHDERSPDDRVLHAGSRVCGPLDHGWYARFLGQPAPTDFRPWQAGDLLSARNLREYLSWRLGSRQRDATADPWAEWFASLSDLYFLRLEEEIPASRLMAWEPQAGAAAPPSRGGDLSAFASRIGVHVHLHYQDLWPEIRASLANLPPGFGLHLTANSGNAALFQSIAAEFPGATVTLVPNRGRDVGAFLGLLGAGAFDRYAYVCKIHSKKSPVEGRESYFGRAWRRRSIADLLGSPGQIRAIVDMFEADPEVGLVGSAVLRQPNPRVGRRRALRANRENIESLLSRCAGRSVPAKVDYFAGSMFWFRPGALRTVRALAIGPGDFPEEPCESDGTLAHALERVIPTAAALSGYRIADVSRSV